VALRKYLLENGHQTRENGGDVGVQPAKNADIVALMIKKDIDGAWVPEPWGAKLVKDTDSRVFLDERDLWPGGEFVTAHIVVRTEFLEQNPEIVKKIVRTNVEQTEWINAHPDEAVRIFNEELEKLTGLPTTRSKSPCSSRPAMHMTWGSLKKGRTCRGYTTWTSSTRCWRRRARRPSPDFFPSKQGAGHAPKCNSCAFEVDYIASAINLCASTLETGTC
jgi:hypothetical protein